MAIGRLQWAQATLRVIAITGPKTFSSAINTLGGMITAANNNAATIFLSSASNTNATIRRWTNIPLTAGQSVSVTGLPLFGPGTKSIELSSDNFYVMANATPNVMILTYLKQT